MQKSVCKSKIHLLPGLKFSIMTSLFNASLLTNLLAKVVLVLGSGSGITHSRPSGFRRSMQTLFLFLPILLNHGLVPSTSSSLQTRRGSPPFGGSILIISAPNCLKTCISKCDIMQKGGHAAAHPSSCPANGPATSCPSSKTRMPFKGMLSDWSDCIENNLLLPELGHVAFEGFQQLHTD